MCNASNPKIQPKIQVSYEFGLVLSELGSLGGFSLCFVSKKYIDIH